MVGKLTEVDDAGLIRQLSSPLVQERVEAALELGQRGGRDAASALVGLLGDEPKVRRAVCTALARMPRAAAIAFTDAVRSGRFDKIKAGLLQALQRVGGPATNAILALLDDEDVRVRRWARELLSPQDARIIPGLVARLHHPREATQIAAVILLGGTRHRSAIRPLVDRLYAAESEHAEQASLFPLELRERVKTALGKLARREPDETCRALESLPETSDAHLVLAEALAKVSEPRALPSLLKLQDHEDFGNRLRVARVLRKYGHFAAAVEALTHLARDPDDSVRKAAVRSMGRSKNRVLMPELVAATADRDWHVSAEAIYSLASFGQPAVDLLVRVAGERPASDTLIDALSKCLHWNKGYRVCELIQSENEQLRLAAIDALDRRDQSLDLNVVVEALVRETRAPNASVRRIAVAHAWQFADQPPVLDAIHAALSDEDSGVREEAAGALSRFEAWDYWFTAERK